MLNIWLFIQLSSKLCNLLLMVTDGEKLKQRSTTSDLVKVSLQTFFRPLSVTVFTYQGPEYHRDLAGII